MAKKKEEEYHGEPIQYDPAFNGPIPNYRRSCTDLIFLIGFILFLGAWLGVGIYAMKEGSIAKLLAPRDSNGRRCGMDSQLGDKKYLVFFDIAKCLSSSMEIDEPCSTPQVCVNKCPEKTIVFKSPQMNEATFHQLKYSMVCTYDVDVQTLSYNQAVENIRKEKCASYVIKSHSVLGRCSMDETEKNRVKEIMKLGDNATRKIDNIIKLTKQMSSTAQIVQELVELRWYMFGALAVVVLVCFILIMVLRWVVRLLVWSYIVAFFATLIIVTHFCNKKYIYYRDSKHGNATTTSQDPNFWLMLVIVLSIKTIIMFLVVIFLRSRINLTIKMIKESSKAIFAIKSQFFPILPWILQCTVIVYGVMVIMLLLSISEAKSDCECIQHYGRACQHSTCRSVVTYPSFMLFLQFVNMMAFLWTTIFITGLGDMILASSISKWYWTFEKRNLPFHTLSSSLFTALRYHMGTVAFGALILTIIRIIRIAASLIRNNIRSKNILLVLICCILKYCLRMLADLFKFISKNAYIMSAIHGTNFCSSARTAYSLLMRNIIQVYVLDKVMDFILFILKVIITIGSCFGFYYFLQWTNGDRLEYSLVPTIIIAIATYIISTIFLNVYAIAVDTLFLCFLEDCERNDGSPEKPYYMSMNLMNILGKAKEKDSSDNNSAILRVD